MNSSALVGSRTARREKLPVVATCVAGWRSAYDELEGLVRIAVWPFIWLVIAQVIGQILAAAFAAPTIVQLTDLSYIVLIPFAVRWLRMLMLGERPATFPKVRFGRTEITFLVYSFLIPIASYFPAFLLAAAAYILNDGAATRIFLSAATLLAIAAGAYVSARLWLVYPEIAIATFGGLRSSWHKTKGSVGRICAIAILVDLPLYIVGLPIALIQARTETGQFADAVLQMSLALLSSAIYRATQAAAYRHLSQIESGTGTI